MMDAIDALTFYVWSNIAVILLLIFLPYILRMIIMLIIRVLAKVIVQDDDGAAKARTRVSQAIAILFFPGSLLRITFIYFYLTMQGWIMQVLYSPRLQLESGSLFSEKKSKGFYLTMKQGKRRFTLRDAILITVLCYIPMVLGILMIVFRQGNMAFIDYIFNRDFLFWRIHVPAAIMNRTVYWYLVLALLFGGAAVPEETTLILYHVIATYNYFLVGCLLALIGSILISYLDISGPFTANYLGVSTLQVFWTILFTKTMLDDREARLFKEDEFTFGEGIQEIAIF